MLISRKLVYLTVLLVQSFFGYAQFMGAKVNNPDNQLSGFELKGRVKSLHVYFKDYNYDEPDSVYQQQVFYKFNNSRYLKSRTIILKEPYYKEVYHYNNKNKVIAREDWNYYRKEWRKVKGNYTYNKKGLVAEIYYKLSDGAKKMIYVYDDENNVTEEKLVNLKDSTVYKRVTYKHDNTNNMIERIEYSDKVVFNRRTFQYDKHKNIIGEKVYGYSMNELHGKFAYKYNKKKQRIEGITYSTRDTTDISHKNFYNYDKKGKLIENKQYFLGEPDGVRIYKYEYDEHKNWIKQSIYRDGKLLKLTKREIMYY